MALDEIYKEIMHFVSEMVTEAMTFIRVSLTNTSTTSYTL